MQEYTQQGQTYELHDKSMSGFEMDELFRNEGREGGFRFSRVGYVSGVGNPLDGRGAVAADFDRDGDLDLFLVNNRQPWVYYENVLGQDRAWAVVELKGKTGNGGGVGARVKLTAAGATQVREIAAGAGYLSTPPAEAHFGLGAGVRRIDRIEVRWPAPSRAVQVVDGVEANRIIVFEEGGPVHVRSLPPPTGEGRGEGVLPRPPGEGRGEGVGTVVPAGSGAGAGAGAKTEGGAP